MIAMAATRYASSCSIQAIYYLLTGLWALVAYRSFEAVTGPKREPWLVKTVGLHTVVIAAALAADPHGRTAAGRRLGIGSAASFAAVAIYYALIRRRIRPIYLADAIVELAFLAAWRRVLKPDSVERSAAPR